MERECACCVAMVLTASIVSGLAQAAPPPRLRAAPLTQVQITDEFWWPRLETNRTITLPHNLKMCEETGRISNFLKAAGQQKGKYEGAYFNDSDVYKVIEGAAYILALHPDKQIEAQIDAIIDKIAAAQQPDGYLNAYYTVMEPDKRWTELPVKHELYCAGHLIEAAVAYAQATGKTKLLDVAKRVADCIDGIFGRGKRIGSPGHEEIELALIKLYQHTGEERYRKLAEFFIEVRGTCPEDKADGPDKAIYRQAHLPVKQQKEIAGHAVRAMYLYCGVTDVAALTGDPEYVNTLETIWRDVVERKIYVTGGVGARHHGEAFGGAYELPNKSAYAETCAGIGLALWNHRLLLLHGEGRFADVLERALYNHVLASVSLKGDAFFYVNPLASDGGHHRQPWFGCACCPPNTLRVLAQLGRFAYAQTDDAIWVNLYVGSTASIKLAGGEVKLSQETRYPWSGQVRIKVEPAKAMDFAVQVRIPAWCEQPSLAVNGSKVPAAPQNGYVAIARKWQAGDTIELDFPMPIRQIQAHPQVEADGGRLAIQRGPIVYCLEAADNNGKVSNLTLPRGATLSERFQPDLLGGVMVIKGQGHVTDPASWKGKLYQPAIMDRGREVEITAVPYSVWDNRQAGEMTVFIPEITGMAE